MISCFPIPVVEGARGWGAGYQISGFVMRIDIASAAPGDLVAYNSKTNRAWAGDIICARATVCMHMLDRVEP